MIFRPLLSPLPGSRVGEPVYSSLAIPLALALRMRVLLRWFSSAKPPRAPRKVEGYEVFKGTINESVCITRSHLDRFVPGTPRQASSPRVGVPSKPSAITMFIQSKKSLVMKADDDGAPTRMGAKSTDEYRVRFKKRALANVQPGSRDRGHQARHPRGTLQA